jgi:retron-type reverse transcriptase
VAGNANEWGETLAVDKLRNKTYKPAGVKQVMIPKGGGAFRPLGTPTIRDRVVQMAAKLVTEPIFEADFCETSFMARLLRHRQRRKGRR